MKSFYSVIDDTQRKIDISTRLILRMMDEDDTVKDLAIKTVEELWFPPAPLQSAMKGKAAGQANQEKSALLMKVSVIMGTAANFSKAHGASPLEDILHKIISEKEGNEAEALHGKYTEICETLIDGLVDASDLPGFVRSILFDCLWQDLTDRFFRPSSTVSGRYTCSARRTHPSSLEATRQRCCRILRTPQRYVH